MTLHEPLDAPIAVPLTVADFELLTESGALDRYHRTELIAGTIVAMNAQYSRHGFAKSRLSFRLSSAVQASSDDLEVVSETSVSIPPINMPQPDIIVVAGFNDGAIDVSRVRLAIEVSDSSLAFDRDVKTPIYAAAGIPEYWIVDVNAAEVHQLWAPAEGAYRERRTVPLAGPLASVTIAGLAVDGAGILPG